MSEIDYYRQYINDLATPNIVTLPSLTLPTQPLDVNIEYYRQYLGKT